jgi:PAS domain S-box-containing protein
MEGMKKLVKNTSLFALVLAILIAVLPPFFYFFLRHQYHFAVLETEAEMDGLEVTEIINASPEYWRYQHDKLEEIISTGTIKMPHETRSILDSGGVVIARSGNEIKRPIMTRSHNLYDSGNVVGRIEISRSLRPVLIDTLAVGLFSFFIGFSVFATLKIFPLRALATTLRFVYEEKEKAQSILNNIPDIAWLKDKDDRYLAANGPFYKTCGVNADDLPGKTDADLWPPDLAEKYRADDREVMETGKPKQVEEPIIDTEGRMTWISTIKTPIFNDKGEVIGTTGIARDFTEWKRIEEALRESEERYRSVVDNVGIGIALISPKMEILSLNEQMRKWFPALVVSQRPICFRSFNRPPREEICSYCPTVKTLKDGQIHESVTETPVEGGVINFKVVSTPLKDSQGNVIAAIELVEDITERRHSENEIRRLNQELEIRVEERTKQLLEAREELIRKEKLAVLGQLAGSVGHELRNPLGVMSNAIYFLKTVLSESDETVREYLNMIKTEIDNSERIISDLLDFSRTKTPQLQSIETSELLSTSLGKCALPENVKMERNISDTLPLLRVDPFQMAQVFQNLILNACQAMSKGGELRIAARKITGGEYALPNVDFIEISVSDTGEGISPENMKVLFHPLFTTKAKGIGLGLVVSKRLTEANGGRIDVESRLGEGTTFTVILPCEGG